MFLGSYYGTVIRTEDFADFYKQLQTRCTIRGFNRALVVVLPKAPSPGPSGWRCSS